MKLKRVEKWTKGKPEIQALLSAFLVIQAEVLYSLLWELLALLDQYERYCHFPNGIAKFNRCDTKKDLGPAAFWRSVQ